VQLERLTRRKNDGSEYQDRCIEEVLSIAGVTVVFAHAHIAPQSPQEKSATAEAE
jgi:hypothetical protein